MKINYNNLILSAAIGYKWSDLKIFIKSLRKVSNDRVIFIVGKNIEKETVEKFSYCPLHLMIVFQPKGKKDEVVDKEDEVPKFIEKKVKSA